jgi:hypothetical protein
VFAPVFWAQTARIRFLRVAPAVEISFLTVRFLVPTEVAPATAAPQAHIRTADSGECPKTPTWTNAPAQPNFVLRQIVKAEARLHCERARVVNLACVLVSSTGHTAHVAAQPSVMSVPKPPIADRPSTTSSSSGYWICPGCPYFKDSENPERGCKRSGELAM